MNTKYIKIKNRHGFATITTTSSLENFPELENFQEVPKTWEITNYDDNGDPWSWFREATEQEVAGWVDSALPFANWIKG